MDKENNRGAAGSRRSALIERIRLREEWSALKGINESLTDRENLTNANKKPQNQTKGITNSASERKVVKNKRLTSDVLSGVVALVEIGMETRALALRAALTALGATVVPNWSPLVTHLVWSEGGCRATRAKARALASRLVSPLWVEACAAANGRLPEQAFPAAARASDLPSPKTLRRLLREADMKNISIFNLMSDSAVKQKQGVLRLSSDTDPNTSTDKSVDTSRDTSLDKSRDSSGVISSRVNTAPRRRSNRTGQSSHPAKSKRKLFTHKEGEDLTADDETDDEVATKMKTVKLTDGDKRGLARAERLARQLVAGTKRTQDTHIASTTNTRPKIVLTGMSRRERQVVCVAIRSLNGFIQKRVSKKTTHVLIGSCVDSCEPTGVTVCSNNIYDAGDKICDIVIPRCDKTARTLNALEGAARGCRVLYAQWAIDSRLAKQWLHHHGYEVAHLKKIAQKARVERAAFLCLRSEYAYDVFCGMRVRVSDDCDLRDAAVKLLTLCNACVLSDLQSASEVDVTIGNGDGEVSSKWVFDSVAAARMRTTRRYVNGAACTNNVSTQYTHR